MDILKNTKSQNIFNLNILDLNFDLSSEKIKQVDLLRSGKFGILEGLVRYIYCLGVSFFLLRFNIKVFNKQNIFFIGSYNQEKALLPISQRIEHINFFHGFYKKKIFANAEFFSYLISFLFIPLFIYIYITKASKFQRRMMRCRFDRYIHTYGLFAIYSLAFSNSNVKRVFFSNDHTVWCRVANVVCLNHGISTVYVQHANTNANFPKLNFNFAFLDGSYSESCYSKEPYVQVFKVGCLRHEKSLENTTIDAKEGVIVCFNKIDSSDFIIETCSVMITSISIVAFRMHPSDKRYDLVKKLESMGLINRSKEESISALSFYRFCVAGNSSVFLDARIAGCVCYTYTGWFGNDDYYGFEKNHIVKCVPNISALIELIMNDNSSNKALIESIYNNADTELKAINKPSLRVLKVLGLVESILE